MVLQAFSPALLSFQNALPQISLWIRLQLVQLSTEISPPQRGLLWPPGIKRHPPVCFIFLPSMLLVHRKYMLLYLMPVSPNWNVSALRARVLFTVPSSGFRTVLETLNRYLLSE